MSSPTKPFINRIAIVFDFDETLVPDSFAVLLEYLGLDVEPFKQESVRQRVEDGWQKVPAKFYALIEESQKRSDGGGDKITRSDFVEVGKTIELFPGVSEMFDLLRNCAKDIVPDIEIEFYLITAGFAQIARSTSIAHNFKAIWGSEFHYGKNDEVKFLKRIMTHTEKTRYLYHLSKGIDIENDKDLVFLYQNIPPEKLHVPLSQTIYIGDGTSDIPCFAVLNEYNGIAIGLYEDETSQTWEYRDKVKTDQQLSNIAPPDYRQGSELMRSLVLAVESICQKIALHRLGIGD
ncbi:MAG: HAD family hydrolase [Cyanobacteriota bacterium]|nr:HAD family hydrolase [Cyanobacteriota bacterium]